MAAKENHGRKIIAQNRKARHNYQIGETFEAGIVLTGTEVKSLRCGSASMGQSYAVEKGGEIFLLNTNIATYGSGSYYNHSPLRERKLLLSKREINKLIGSVRRGGMALVPLSIYFNDKGRVKIELALATGKRNYDKRLAEKEREWKRDRGRLRRGSME